MHSEIRIRVSQEQGTEKIQAAAQAAVDAVAETGIVILKADYSLGHPKVPSVFKLAVEKATEAVIDRVDGVNVKVTPKAKSAKVKG